MAILTSPPSLNISNPLSGISNTANSLTNIKSNTVNKLEPLTAKSGLKYKKPLIDCTKFPLLSLDTIPCPPLPERPKIGLPSKQELVDRVTKFIPKAPDLSLPGIPSLPSINPTNVVKNEINKLGLVPCPAVPTLAALNPFPAYKAQIKLWLNEPITLPKIKDLLPNLPTIPKPPYFTLPCQSNTTPTSPTNV